MSIILANAINTVPMHYLAFLVLAAIPFSFSGVTIKKSDVLSAPASLHTGKASSATLNSSCNTLSPVSTIASVSIWPTRSSTSGEPHISQSNGISVRSPIPPTSTPAQTIIPEFIYTSLPPRSLSQNYSNSTVPDIGHQYGKVMIHNNCNESFYLYSVGAWQLHGFRNDTIGYTAKEEKKMYFLGANGSHIEPYRVTCPPTGNSTMGYCHDYDKLRGQGVSIKISRTPSVVADILQFEYALTQNPNSNDTFLKLHYDVSLLDCADPNQIQFGNSTAMLNATNPRWRNVTDANASVDDYKTKTQRCPGYRGGIKVTFDADPQARKCQPVDCTGDKLCPQMYYFDRTRKDEPSMSCIAEYKGDVIMDLCAGMKRAANGTSHT